MRGFARAVVEGGVLVAIVSAGCLSAGNRVGDVQPKEIWYEIIPSRIATMPFTPDARHTQALDATMCGGKRVMCFGSWGWPANQGESDCRVLGESTIDGGWSAHETAGVGIACHQNRDVYVVFEPGGAENCNGGPKVFGAAGPRSGGYYWQTVSVGGGLAVAAAGHASGCSGSPSCEIDVFSRPLGAAANQGWTVATRPTQVPVGITTAQLFRDPYHYIFHSKYTSCTKTPSIGVIRFNPTGSKVERFGIQLPAGRDCGGVSAAAHVGGVGTVVGTHTNVLPWRGTGTTCAGIGILASTPVAGNFSVANWKRLPGSDVVDILPFPATTGAFAVTTNFPASLRLFHKDVEVSSYSGFTCGGATPQHIGGLAFQPGTAPGEGTLYVGVSSRLGTNGNRLTGNICIYKIPVKRISSPA